MRAHRLDRRITIEQAVTARDETGDETITWQTYCTRWAAVEPVGGSEFWTVHQETGTQQIAITLRYDTQTAAITPKMRASWGGRLLNIEAVVDRDSAHRQIDLMCTWRQLPEVYP